MPPQIDLEVQDHLLLVVVSGPLTFDESLSALLQICDAAVDQLRNRILIDLLAAETPRTTIERYLLGTKLVAYCGERSLDPRLAVVGQLPVVDGFGILVAKNRGLTAEVFPSQLEALQWLNSAPK